MYGTSGSHALEKAIELAKANLENTEDFVKPETVIDFITKVSDCLTGSSSQQRV